MRLSKSDFKVALECPTKLFYKKKKYPSLLDNDLYLKFLADGGYMVEAMARLLYPGGVVIGSWSQPEKAFEETKAALDKDRDAVLFEPTVIHDKYLARVDILQRFGNILRLIEVKSVSLNSEEDGPDFFRGAKGGITSKIRPYLEDVAFQIFVLRQAFPQYEIHPYLCVVDKAKTATENLTFDRFKLTRSAGSWAPNVDFTGDPSCIPDENLLIVCDVSDEVNELLPKVSEAAHCFADSIDGDSIERIAPEIGQKCKKCEYRIQEDGDGLSGFHECWGDLADPDPHILDLIRIDLAGGKKCDLVAELAGEGKAQLVDVPVGILSGATAERQLCQIDCHVKGTEFISPNLPHILSQHARPLYFIDFEGSTLAIPYHEGMHPYEQAGFQWSCHTLDPEGNLSHSEWLNAEEAFPNFAFARSLREQIGDSGTVYIWSPYEITMLRHIRRQMDDYGEGDDSLKGWLDRMIADEDGRIVDLLVLARQHYYHPSMKGSFSIKAVLPAAWAANKAVQEMDAFEGYVKYGNEGQLLNPYKSLPPLPIGEKSEVVNEGTGAMRVYQEMMFGQSASDPEHRENYRSLLLQYCKLDTAAMVIIWMHWMGEQAAIDNS
jgi:hypothetical protein